MSEKMPERIWAFDDNVEGLISMRQEGADTTKYLRSTPTLEHAREAITILYLINAQLICGTVTLKYAPYFDPEQIVTDKLECRLKDLLATIEAEEKQ